MAAPISAEGKTPYVFLGRSGLKVSNIALGSTTFGESQFGRPGQMSEDLSHEILNRYTEWGGNFLDTADVYGHGGAERIIGKWLERQPRDKFVVATKCRFSLGAGQSVNSMGLSRRNITASIEGSLQRLHTDFVDLYQTHLFDDATPIEETLRTLDDLVRVGKIRYIGVSNVTGWQLQKLVGVTKRLGLNPIISLQQQYSLASRTSELEVFQVCKSSGIGVLPWSALKGGFLTGKIKRDVKPTEGRIAWATETDFSTVESSKPWQTFDSQAFDVVDTLEAISKTHSKTIAQVAIRWLLQRDVVSSVIIGARTLAQLDDNMGVNGWSLTKEEMQQLDTVSTRKSPYPYDFIFGLNSNRVNKLSNDNYVTSTA
uniref:NADP-dependent oxidoreductase domain-containing protein n=3 Tax=Arion vulgaris TaxID=1028688 RepID=A0A0B7BMB5_9EUPU